MFSTLPLHNTRLLITDDEWQRRVGRANFTLRVGEMGEGIIHLQTVHSL
jgi:hypothetical protein